LLRKRNNIFAKEHPTIIFSSDSGQRTVHQATAEVFKTLLQS